MVRDPADADWCRLRSGSGPVAGGAAELGRAASARDLGRHHEFLSTMLIALFGAIVAGTVTTGGVAPGALDGTLNPEAALAAEAFRRVFFMIAGTLTVALVAVLLLEEKPLQTGVAPEIK